MTDWLAIAKERLASITDTNADKPAAQAARDAIGDIDAFCRAAAKPGSSGAGEAALREALWTLHQADHDMENDETWCSSCHAEWPCPTAAVLLASEARPGVRNADDLPPSPLPEPESADPITQAKAAADAENREGDPAFNGALNRW